MNYSFDRLSIQDQSDLIREFIKAGIYDLNQMKDHYEKFELKEGGHTFEDGGELDGLSDEDIARVLTQQRGWGFTGLSDSQKRQEIANYRNINGYRPTGATTSSQRGFLTRPLGGESNKNKTEDFRESFKRKFGYIMDNRELEKARINDALRREKEDRLKMQYELGRRRSGAIELLEGTDDPVFLGLTAPAIIPKLGFSTLLGAGTRIVGNSFNDTKMGNIFNTGLNALSPFLGPFGKGISIADTYYDGKQFLQNPSLYNVINFGMNYFNYNPYTTSDIDEKIASGWELFDGLINNK